MKEVLLRTKAKGSFTLVVSDSSVDIQITFTTPIYLEVNHTYELAMVNLETYWSTPSQAVWLIYLMIV